MTTKRLNEQVKRNIDRFPQDFMFQLTVEESRRLRSQSATSSEGWGGPRYRPHAFTEHGAIMAAGVLNSERAVQMSIYVVRAFVSLRQSLAAYRDLSARLAQLEAKCDARFKVVFEAIRRLMAPPTRPKRRIGFLTERGT